MPVILSPQFYVRKMRVILTSAPAIAYGTRFDAVCMIIIYHTPFYHTFGTKCSTSSTTPRPRMYYPRYVLHVVHVKAAVEPRRQSKAWSCIVGTNDEGTCVTSVKYVQCLYCKDDFAAVGWCQPAASRMSVMMRRYGYEAVRNDTIYCSWMIERVINGVQEEHE